MIFDDDDDDDDDDDETDLQNTYITKNPFTQGKPYYINSVTKIFRKCYAPKPARKLIQV